jgi:hypothetical protein
MTVKDNKFLIIGGTTKAGTTSIYNYLSNHPQVSTSYRKEVNYFLDKEIGEPSLSRFEGDIETYGVNFNFNNSTKVYTEASPGYLYSPGTPSKIKALPFVKVIFILREPYDRLLSWYKFSIQISASNNISINDFIKQQLDTRNSTLPNYLEQGKYSLFLQKYYDVLSSDDIKIMFYEDLKSRPLEFMNEICEFIDIDPEYYDDFKFFVSNKSMNMRSNKIHKYYISARRNMSLMMPRGYFYIRNIWQHFKPLYLKLNATNDKKGIAVEKSIQDLVVQFYSGEKEKLEDMLDRKVPW